MVDALLSPIDGAGAGANAISFANVSGAELEAYYPVSALAHGQAMNVTVMSYAGGLYFGFTACPDKVPHVQRLAVYTGDALDELEAVFMPKRRQTAAARKKARTATRRTRAAARPKARSG